MNFEVILCLFSIEQAFAKYEWSEDDLKILRKVYEQGLFYSSIVDNETLCSKNTTAIIFQYCQLIRGVLSAPNAVQGITFTLEKSKHFPMTASGNPKVSTFSLIIDKYKEVIFDFKLIFQKAVFVLSSRLKAESTISPLDSDNAYYVIGMAGIIINNIQSLINSHGLPNKSDYSSVYRFYIDSARFAESLKKSKMVVS